MGTLLTLLLSAAAAADVVPPGTRETKSMEHGGLTRTWHLYKPASGPYPRPVLFALHGGGGTGEGFVTHVHHDLDRAAAAAGFAIVYPEGVKKAWNDGRGIGSKADDHGFLTALADRLVKDGVADPKGLYAAGISNGGFMSHALACRDGGRWAAIGVIASSLGEIAAASCKPPRPVPVLMVNGTEDRLIPWDGREVKLLGRSRGRKLTVPETAAKWAALDGCSGEPVREDLPDAADDGTRWSLEARRNCKAGAEVLLYKVTGGGHTWPNAEIYLPRVVGRTSRDVAFEPLLFEFFKRHPLPGAK
ncbi:hypothetical protein EPO15_07775 [bacterium]|nr:MAG: hypothetical protein EPO15_07775 [bacterium]